MPDLTEFDPRMDITTPVPEPFARNMRKHCDEQARTPDEAVMFKRMLGIDDEGKA